jgi:hypothetical protein
MKTTRPNCSGHGLTRRHFLFGAAGATLLAPHADAEISTSPVKLRNSAKTTIFINLNGGNSHLDTWDPKDGPWNPPDVKLNQVSGLLLSQTYFPKLTSMADGSAPAAFLRQLGSGARTRAVLHPDGALAEPRACSGDPAYRRGGGV